ncbi:MAG TPA: pyridoxamine 5'-phosphate oxidase family protein [Methylomirabilota bacterium]|nr:pyridoxamine 5'-phosphate oxidase family protein [Methylomirabilota bacterium]
MPYHEGERRVQERAGVREMAGRIGRSIRSEVPDRAADFLAVQRMLVVGTVDDGGRPWASIFTGRPGFVTAPDPGTVIIEAALPRDDPAAAGLRTGAPIGTLAIDLGTRRRARVNAVIRSAIDDHISIGVQESYANCPKYIQRRTETGADDAQAVDLPARQEAARSGPSLTAAQAGVISRVDTFFVATTAPGAGTDASHRGGNPGFIRVTPHDIVWPDYVGNSMFNTLGNIEVYGRAGLAFVGFDDGTLLQVTGAASLDWNPRRVAEFQGAERLVRLEVERVVESTRRLPSPLELVEYSPFNPG